MEAQFPLLHLAFLLFFGHALADYPLQNKYMAMGKNPWREIEHEDVTKIPYARKWYHRMAAHCIIHAGFVYVFTGYLPLALLEFVLHGTIDLLKCSRKISSDTDQLLHILCKIFYVCAIAYIGGI